MIAVQEPTAAIQAGLVSSDVVPVDGSGQDGGGGAGVGARLWTHGHQLRVAQHNIRN